ncbi:zinc-ribbon domain-containing protein [Agathobaculum sp. LCP25S3_E8]|uniref:zinc ribbon domain-containing protein n=1 Tax=Agathobaculum sp. LCP25S3_E8 TaxID=3438735 RepID=UPI003F93C7F9
MFCWKCGKEVSPDSKFCEYCGSVLNHGQVENVAAIPPKKRKRKKVIISVIAAVLVVAIGVGGFFEIKKILESTTEDERAIFAIEDQGSSTPEELVAAFTSALQTLNFDQALTCFDIVNAAQSNVGVGIERSGIYSVTNASAWGQLPTEHESYRAYIPLNEVGRLSCSQRDIIYFIFDLLLGDSNFTELQDIADSKMVAFPADNDTSDAVTYADLFAELDPMQLSTLNFVELIYVDPEVQDDERNRQNIAKACEQYHCDDVEHYYVIYTLNGQYYCGSMILHHYDEGWKIYTLNSSLAYMGIGEVIPISRQEYLDLVQTHKLEKKE